MKGYEKSSTQCVYILRKIRKRICAAASEYILCRNREKICATASERKCAADIFYVEDARKFPNRICHNNAGTEIRTKTVIFNMFFDVILIPRIQRITLLLNHQRRFS